MTNELQRGDVQTPRQKRSHEDSNDVNVPRKSQKVKDVPVNINGKNPVALLNELRPGLAYTILQKSGPVHAPIFTMSVTIDGQSYEGVGGNKKTAKARAAENALRSFIQFPHTNVDANSPKKNIDFTSDDFNDNNSTEKKVNLSFLAAFPKLKPQDLSKGPVMLLNEIYPGLKYSCVSSKEDTFEKFKTTVEVNGETFTGVGSSKKNSKCAAAKSALAKLLNVQQTPGMKNLTNSDMPFTNVSVAQELTDYIGTLICEKFSSLMVDDPTHSKRKVLAGIVMTKGDDKGKDGEVICVTTGTKCVSGEHISLNGVSLNDMHAEIVSRRCLIDYLYDQLEMMTDPEKAKDSILTPRSEGDGYRLKEGIQFHLYINTAPCGDARIFSPHEELTNAVDRHPNRRARGQLRTKIESGEGTIPVKSSSSMQTWDGILQGERLLTMSCSDKIARWNVLGLQGSLLSHFIEPIYLHTIVLGSLLHPVHMYRAICGRIENTVQGLPPPYRLNRPEMALTTSSEVRRPIKAPNFSVNWTIGQSRHEVVNCLTGKTEQGVPSRLCKLAMFRRFLNIRPKISSITGVHREDINQAELMYGQAKNSVDAYNIAKQNLGEAFVKADLGCWIKKPLEQDQFYVD